MRIYLSRFFKYKLWLKLFFITLSLIGIFITQSTLYGQLSNTAEAYDQYGYGFYLKKVVSDTSICTGVTFSYTIYFSFPAGTQYAKITDQIPSALNFHSIAVTNACGTPSVNAPTPGTNGTVTAVWSSVPSTGCSGSMTIVVSFPNGVTCNGTQVRNLVCIDAVYLGAEGNVKVNFCTPAVMTTARAINPWKIQKQVQQGSWQDGNCNWRVNNDTVTYKICVYKNNSYTCGSNGQLNLVNGVVTDILPTGAQFISATQPISISGNTITWNVGNLDATATYNTVCCDIKVYYPQSSFPNGTQITNTAILSGQLGNANSPCPQSQFSYSYSVCCEIHRCSGTTFDFFKGGWTNGQPGCAGSYYIQFHNTGTTSLSANTVVISDELPPVLNLVSATSYGGNITITTSGNTFTGTLNTTLPADGWIYITINFTISSSAVPNSTVTNCAYVNVQGLPLDSACWTFVINSPKPRPCLWKEICSPQGSYNIGQTIRMRMRIQNIGGQSISGAIITDNLNENFEYIGNPIYYVSTAWNTPCNPTIGSGNVTTWSPSPNLTVSGQSISITNVNIPSSCQNIFWDGCGMYGNGSVPYHWIEFDVKIKDTAGLGNIPNSFTISGGNLTEPTNSNTVYVLTTGTIGFNLIKEVAPADTSSWSSNIILSPGENFYYKLRMQVAPASIPLRKVTFVDLLPKDAITIDNKILASPCMARGSLFDITYQSDIFTNPFANLYRNPSINQASANGIAPIILFPSSCGIETGWVGTPPLIGDKNIGIFFPTAIGAGSNGEVKFKAKVSSAGTTNQTSCNSFAAGGSVLHYLNSTTSEEIAVTPLESDKVCVNINETNNCYAIKPSQFNLVDSSENGCVYKIQISFSNITGSDIAGCAFSPQGTVEPSNFNVPIGSSMLTFTFTDTPPQDDYVCIYFGIREATGNCMVCDSACDELPPCSSSMDCCPKWDKIGVQCAYKDEESNQVYSINATIAIPSRDCLPLTLIINSPDGTFSPSVFTINSLTYTINTEFTDTPPSNINTNITIEFTFYSNNQIVCKESYKLLIPNCEEPINDCCKGLNQNVITTASRLRNGIILITGTAFPNTPIKRFSATIVSAQRKLMGPIIGSWERIYGDFTDFTSCVITNPPGPLQILTPFSREMVWEGNCLDGSPGVLKLYATFPQPSSSMSLARSDSLKFTIRYSFTTCDCKTCDTLITYTLYRSSPIIIDLSNTATLLPLSKNTIQLDIPQIYSEPDDNIKISIMALEIYSLAKNNVIKSGKIIGPRENKDLISTTSKGGIVVLLDTKTDEIPLQIQLEGGVSKGIIVRYHYCIQDGEDEDCTGIEERVYPLNLDVGDANATIVKQEGIVDNIRTFSLAILNEGKTTLSGVRLQLSPLPQDDGTIPSILAIGSPTSPELIIKKYQNAQSGLEPQSNTEYEFSEDIVEPNNAIKPIYITVSGIAKQFGTEKVSFNYTLIDGNSQEVGAGTIVVEGAISGIIQMPGDEGAIPSLKPHISAIIPNPAMETATVSIWSPLEVSDAIIEFYDIHGGLVKTTVLPILPKGSSAITIDLSDYSSGAYMVILKTHRGTSTKNMVIIK